MLLVSTAVMVAAPSPVITVTSVLLPVKASPSWAAAADKVIAAAKAGTFGTNTTIASPTDYAVCNYSIGWQNLIYSASTVNIDVYPF